MRDATKHRRVTSRIRGVDVPLIRELLTAADYENLLKRLEVNSCAGA